MSSTAPLEQVRSDTVIHGVQLRPLDVNRDRRGFFTEVYCANWELPVKPVQWSLVSSKPRVLRGMHIHFHHDEYIAVLQGRACVGLHDFRDDSPTKGQSALIELNGTDQACLSFPRGIFHGWYFYENTLHLQAVSQEYQHYGPIDNNGCIWSDPDLGIAWPDDTPVVSERAAKFPTLARFTRNFGLSE